MVRKKPARERMIKFLEKLEEVFQQDGNICVKDFESICDDLGITKNQQRAFFDQHRLLNWLDDELLAPSAEFNIFLEYEKEAYQQYLKERNEI